MGRKTKKRVERVYHRHLTSSSGEQRGGDGVQGDRNNRGMYPLST